MQGCQILHFQARNPNLGKFGRVFQWKMLIFYSHLVYFSRFGMLYQENLATLVRSRLYKFQVFLERPQFRKMSLHCSIVEPRISTFTSSGFPRKALFQGCQIFLGTSYQNGVKYTKNTKGIPKLRQLIPNVIKCT
jgi:hypothetical protein